MTPTHDEATAWQWLLRAVGAEPPAATPEVIGRITLLPHQRQAVAALHPLLETRRIALLADDTGLGKTYVACALARRAERPLVVAPAALRNTWRAALDAAGLSAPFLSHEALSRQDAASASPDFVIIDEAHHARTPTTRRWHRLARLCRSARVLLLSATPIHNRPRDFAALIALGLGPEALHWPVSRLLPLVVRRDHRVLTAVADESAADHRAADHRAADDPAPALGLTMPSIAPWQWHAVPVDISVAAALAALPPALPASDGTEAAALWRLALLRAWASSTAALVAAVRRRIARGLALAQGLASDQWLSRELLARWTCDDVATPELPLEAASHDPAAAAVHQAADASAGPVARVATWRATVDTHVAALRALLPTLAADASDAARVQAVAASLDARPATRAVLFCAEAATAQMYWRALRHRPGVALVSGGGARIASGPVDRALVFDALDRDGPARRHAREQVRLLIATDVASEGLNLSAASLVWHADLPWTPARIAQRVGRVARLASPHATVTIHAFAPPGDTDTTLAVRRRLDDKAAVAAPLGTGGPWRRGARPDASPAGNDIDDDIDDARWALRQLATARAAHATPPARAARAASPLRPATVVRVAARPAEIAVLRGPAGLRLCTLAPEAPPDDSPLAAWRAMADVAWDRPPPATAPKAVRAAARRLATLTTQRRAAAIVQSDATSHADVRALLARLARELRTTPPHRRAAVADIAAAWRARLAAPIPAGWRPELCALGVAPVTGAAWWAAARATIAELPPAAPPVDRDEVVARFVLVPAPGTR